MGEWQIGDSRFRRVSGNNRTRLERVFLWAALPLVLTFFFAGYWWQSDALSKADAGIDKLADSPARQAALDAIDEAIEARSEGRSEGALNALARARSLDPRVPSLHLLFAMLALKQGDADSVRLAARSAVKNGESLADANVILGVERWRARGLRTAETSAAAQEASALFSEAAQADPVNGSVNFFWADVMRGCGEEAQGHRLALAALHRMDPWESSFLIRIKAALAAAEAGDGSASWSVPTAQDAGLEHAVLELRRAIGEGGDPASAVRMLRRRLTAAQAALLASDPGLVAARSCFLEGGPRSLP